MAKCMSRLEAGASYGVAPSGSSASRSQQQLTPEVFRHFCATMIQAWWRGALVAKWYARNHVWPRIPVYQIAALEIQDAWREARERLQHRRIAAGRAVRSIHPALAAQRDARSRWSEEDWAALAIQRLYWRRSYGAVFSHFKNLLRQFAGRGDPRQILRAINPREAALLDAASQCRVMLRLGGARFPPSIYYLVVTEGPVCDVGAFAPRQYHAAG